MSFDDLINRLSFILGVLNYGENLTQSDKQDLLDEFQKETTRVLDEIHSHLQAQDEKLDRILGEIK